MTKNDNDNENDNDNDVLHLIYQEELRKDYDK